MMHDNKLGDLMAVLAVDLPDPHNYATSLIFYRRRLAETMRSHVVQDGRTKRFKLRLEVTHPDAVEMRSLGLLEALGKNPSSDQLRQGAGMWLGNWATEVYNELLTIDWEEIPS